LYETTILRKLGFSINFPRKLMYVLKEMLGLGLLLPSTMIVIQRLKLFFSNKRSKSNLSRMINALEEQMWVEGGINKNVVNDLGKSYWTESWIDEVCSDMKKRNIRLISKTMSEFRITSNKTIMQYAREYTSKSSNETIVLKLINHVRLYKRVFLPFELIGNSGKEQTEAYRIQEKQSQIK